MSATDKTISELLLLDLPLLIEMLAEQTSEYSHLLATQGFSEKTSQAKERVLKLQAAIEIKQAAKFTTLKKPPATQPGENGDAEPANP